MFREPRSALPKVFIDPRVEIKESPVHGWGGYAKEDIESHVIIESAPVILCHHSIMDALHEMNQVRHIMQDYPFGWKDGMIAYAMGWAAVYNHKRENNCNWKPNFEYNTLEFTTKRKILAGEEIFVRYVPLQKVGYLWFEDDEEVDTNLRTLEKLSSKKIIF
jgi:hypothetical protein